MAPQAEIKKDDVNVIRIEGIYYDTVGLAKIHPGGELHVLLSNGTDGTALFNTSHRRRFPHDRYKKYQVDASKVPKDLIAPMDRDFTLFWEVCEALKPVIGGAGFAPAHYWVKVAVILGVSMYCDFYSTFIGTSLMMSLVQGLFFGFIGLNLQHDANHGAVSKHAIVNRLLGLTQDYIGGTAMGWMMNHNVVHHVHCNDPVLDKDLQMPFMRLTPKTKWMPMHLAQQVYLFALEAIFGFVHVLSNFVNIWRGPQGHQKLLAPFWNTHRLMSMIFPARCLLGWYFQGFEAMAQHVLIAYCFGGAYLAFFFLMSHNFEGVEKNLDSTSGCFVKLQAVTSSNVGGWLLAQFNGGLNYQIEHHLFPRVHHSYYPYIAPVLRKICEREKIAYKHFPWVQDNVISTFKHLTHMGKKTTFENGHLAKKLD